MISAKFLGKSVERFIVDNAPTILSGVGVVGAVGTAVLTAKATFDAARIIRIEDQKRLKAQEVMNAHGEPDENILALMLDNKEKALLVWKQYLPAAGICTVTVAAIVCANRMSIGRAAALAAAYSLNDKRFNEYKAKVAEKFNPTQEEKVRTEIAQDQVNRSQPVPTQLVVTGRDEQLFYDQPSGRYFKSDMETIRKLQNDLNRQVTQESYVTLNDWYMMLGLQPTPYSDELGWNNDKHLDVQFSATMSGENLACMAIDYDWEPMRNFRKGGCDYSPPF